jgi:parvulin-like peptidyl-prolyl isomerase
VIFRHPAPRFAAIGALLYALAGWLGANAVPLRPATAPAATTDDDTLLRAALARGLDRDDPVVQARLLRDMKFLTDSAADGSALYRDAVRLRLADSDLIVRRRLIERMRLRLQAPAFDAEPSELELQAYLDRHAARFGEPARLRLAQIFLSRAQHGDALGSDANAMLQRLRADDVEHAGEFGDPLPAPTALSAASRDDLARFFGPGFAAAAFRLEPQRWSALASPYGVHLVWVHERLPAAPARLDAVRTAVRAALLDERADAALQTGIRALRAAPGNGAAGR